MKKYVGAEESLIVRFFIRGDAKESTLHSELLFASEFTMRVNDSVDETSGYI